MRLFFALWPEATLRHELAGVADLLHEQCGGRRMRDATLHLTLAFLGEVPEDEADGLVALCEGFDCPPGQWELDHLGYFPRGGIVWLGSRDTPAQLDMLQARLWQALAERGFIPPARPFLPHITLLRKANEPPQVTRSALPLEWRYNRFCLIHSVADGSGRRYEVLAQSATA